MSLNKQGFRSYKYWINLFILRKLSDLFIISDRIMIPMEMSRLYHIFALLLHSLSSSNIRLLKIQLRKQDKRSFVISSAALLRWEYISANLLRPQFKLFHISVYEWRKCFWLWMFMEYKFGNTPHDQSYELLKALRFDFSSIHLWNISF